MAIGPHSVCAVDLAGNFGSVGASGPVGPVPPSSSGIVYDSGNRTGSPGVGGSAPNDPPAPPYRAIALVFVFCEIASAESPRPKVVLAAKSLDWPTKFGTNRVFMQDAAIVPGAFELEQLCPSVGEARADAHCVRVSIKCIEARFANKKIVGVHHERVVGGAATELEGFSAMVGEVAVWDASLGCPLVSTDKRYCSNGTRVPARVSCRLTSIHPQERGGGPNYAKTSYRRFQQQKR